ncbi:MAG TPA: alpha/beta hydrolase, partial [Bryobacteraceae bacterium]|nr:alpha/beta hydrolase [Bryobacteraceae bacterium]
IDPTEGLEQIQSKSGSELLEALRTPIILPTASASDGDGGVASFDSSFVDEDGSTQGIGSFVSSIFGRVGQFLNMTTWYLMKDRSGNVGKNGVADAVRDFKKNLPAVKVHLVGHSLGGRLMAACAKQLSVNPLVQADSLTLLQAAFSHFGLSSDRSGRAGFFQDVMAKKVVRGPMVATFSNKDKVVGLAYALASRLAGDTTKAVGDANDPFGGIGRNGAQNANGVSQTDLLHAAGSAYSFPLGVVNCLDGSNNLINSHGDVTSPAVTYAFASAVAQT